jgi:diguanylate cyclase (GGDEF)-like protein/PAS domain S-box-containing protein
MMLHKLYSGRANRFKFLLILFSVIVIGAIVIVVYPSLGPTGAVFIVIPVSFAAWTLGWQAGIAVSLLGISMISIIFAHFGSLNLTGLMINSSVLIGISMLIGWVHRILDRERQLSQELQKKNKLLSHIISDTEDFSSALIEQTTELNKILGATKAMTTNIDTEETVTVIAREIALSINASGCTVSSWLKESDKILTLLDYRIEEFDGFVDRGNTYPLSKYPATRSVLEQDRIVKVYRNDPDADPAEVEFLREQNAFSLLMLPIKYKGEVIGLVELDNIEERKFTEEDINKVQKLLDHAGIAFHNARLFEKIQYRLKEQTLLTKAVTTITTSLDSDVTLQRLCEQLCLALEATSVYVCTIEEETRLCTVISEYFGPNATQNEKVSDLGETYLVEDPRFIEFIHKGIPMTDYVDSLELDQVEQEHMTKYDAKTILHIPLTMKNEAKGFIEVWDSSRKREFSEHEINLGKALAEHTSIALENTFLHNQVREAESRLRSIAENSPDHVMLLDKDLIIRYVNYASPGQTVDQLLGSPLYSCVEGNDSNRIKQILQTVLETKVPDVYETEYYAPGGKIIYYESRVSPLLSEEDVSGLVVNSRDISQRKEMEKQLEFLALHDPLTELPNRRFLKIRLEETIKLVTRQNLRMEIAILDLDNFKEINDTYGHTTGDQVLIELGKRLKMNLRGSDFPARYGGDEFIVLFVDGPDTAENRFHERFESILSAPIHVDNHLIHINASVGYSSYYGEENITGEEIMKQADDAMYRLKNQKKNVRRVAIQPGQETVFTVRGT